MIHQQIESYILNEVDNQITIFDADYLAELLDTTERSIRQTVYLMQEKGYPIIQYKGREYIYIVDKAEPTHVDAVLKEARQKHKAAMSSLKRYWGLIKTLPLKEQQDLREEFIADLNFDSSKLSVHPQQNEIEAIIDKWNEDLLEKDSPMPILKAIAEETV